MMPSAALGPMPRHISRLLKPEPVVGAAVVSAPQLEETQSWGYRPR
jgi:hypothetical protein